jgi:hypothetical protein
VSGELMTGDQALIARLEDENARLRRELAEKDQEIRAVESQNAAAVKNLRRALNPLYTALRQVYGEMDVIDPIDTEAPAPASSAKVEKVWADWKSKLPGSCGKVIDALLLHGPMNPTQIVVAAKVGTNTLYGGTGVIARMNKAGLWTKGSDGRFALRTF